MRINTGEKPCTYIKTFSNSNNYLIKYMLIHTVKINSSCKINFKTFPLGVTNINYNVKYKY